MKNRRGRPRKTATQSRRDSLIIRCQADEKKAFNEAAELAGIQLSPWVRERLRLAAQAELERAGRAVPFLGNASKKAGE